MKKFFLFVFTLVFVSCVTLDEKGKVVKPVESVDKSCQYLGVVSGEGGTAEIAENRARNAAGKKEANHIVIKSIDKEKLYEKGGQSIVFVIIAGAYSCKD